MALQASSGATVAETATRLSISPNTVKTHLRRIFAKTGAGGRAEPAGIITMIRSATGEGPAI